MYIPHATNFGAFFRWHFSMHLLSTYINTNVHTMHQVSHLLRDSVVQMQVPVLVSEQKLCRRGIELEPVDFGLVVDGCNGDAADEI
jgi:hypothetical protein